MEVTILFSMHGYHRIITDVISLKNKTVSNYNNNTMKFWYILEEFFLKILQVV